MVGEIFIGEMGSSRASRANGFNGHVVGLRGKSWDGEGAGNFNACCHFRLVRLLLTLTSGSHRVLV